MDLYYSYSNLIYSKKSHLYYHLYFDNGLIKFSTPVRFVYNHIKYGQIRVVLQIQINSAYNKNLNYIVSTNPTILLYTALLIFNLLIHLTNTHKKKSSILESLF